ncbi:hypothetical protein [Roseibium sp.]|uniref:hypothetical protein n=1 Tax=Roseibium sp. TaxID=1936156 RepID=UPI003BA93768
MATNANAVITSVSGPNSSAGVAAAIIANPAHVLDDVTTNSGQQGFNEAQNVVLGSAISVDGGSIAAGTTVNSHMIFLNSSGNALISHFSVDWTFSGTILGVMSDKGGTLEAATSSVLGALGTNYTVPFPGSGAAAPFNARGLEQNDGQGDGSNDGYSINGNVLTLGMKVTEPGDWIRVVTATTVPIPAALPLLGGALAIGGFLGWRRKRSEA